ncbi:MAG: hypothetical protein JWM92_217, partial [Candidatus Nomurabacteria bacterium]|nr:hypothetical protein [Candidatus Nomurabacteria bacterium]
AISAPHAPFKKAFTATPPALQMEELPAGTARVFRPITVEKAAVKKPITPPVVPQDPVPPNTAISPALTELLSSLDATADKLAQSAESVQEKIVQPQTPFTGEKTLRDTIPPVKLNERGPTEKNRDLLKAALQSIAQEPKKPSAVPPPAPVIVAPSTTNISLTIAAPEISPVAGPTSAPTPSPTATVSVPTTAPEEVSYQTLQKTLE